MSTKLNKKAYQDLIEYDIKTLIKTMSDCLVRDHIIEILRDSVNFYYGHPIEFVDDTQQKIQQ